MSTYTCERCGAEHGNEFSETCPACDRIRESGGQFPRRVPPRYPVSTSPSAMYAEGRVYMDDDDCEGQVIGAFLSTTKPRRALWRFIAWMEKRYPNARRYEAHFPALDIYCGEEP